MLQGLDVYISCGGAGIFQPTTDPKAIKVLTD